MTHFDIGDRVQWNWGGGTTDGAVEEKFTDRVVREIKGSEIVRNATPEAPAYLVRQDDGDPVLKLHSEIGPA